MCWLGRMGGCGLWTLGWRGRWMGRRRGDGEQSEWLGFSGEGLRSSRERLTQVGTIMGTPGFMSPEQISGQPTDERSDQWSFCAALYEALYGRCPLSARRSRSFAAKVVAGELPAQFPSPPTGVAIPAVIESALRRGLSRKPEERFPSMAALTAALEVGLSAEADSRESQRIKRRVALIVGLLAVLLVGVRQATWARVQPESLWGPTLLSSLFLPAAWRCAWCCARCCGGSWSIGAAPIF